MIDIIIPVYNTPKKDLIRCFNSINKQTFKDYLVYVINDGSNNETRDFLNKYALQNDKYIIAHTNNKGVSHARNVGIDLSKNKYITFIDSDDTIEKDFLKEAYTIIEKEDLDLIIGGYNEIRNNTITRKRKCLEGLHIYIKDNMNLFLEKLISSKTNDNNKEIGDCPTGRIYTRLFKKDSLKGLRFNENIKMSEDTLFMINYVRQASKIGIIDKIWYNYYKNDYSISNSTKNNFLITNIKDFLKEIEILMNEENNKDIVNAYKERINKANNYIKEIENDNNTILLEKINKKNKETLYRLLQYSLFEESLYDGNELNDNGLFSYEDFNDYFNNKDKIAFFIKEHNTNKLLGFIMLSINDTNCIKEFMILPKYRRNNIGKKAAFKCFNMYKGKWIITPSFGSEQAYKFWKKVIDEYTNNNNKYIDKTFIFNN